MHSEADIQLTHSETWLLPKVKFNFIVLGSDDMPWAMVVQAVKFAFDCFYCLISWLLFAFVAKTY